MVIADVSMKRRKRPVYRGRPRIAFADVKRGDKIMMRKGGIQVLDEVFGLNMTLTSLAVFCLCKLNQLLVRICFFNTKHAGPVK